MPHRTVTTDSQLAALCRELAEAPRIALDTEFVAERRYQAQLCLVQVADPLTVARMTPFWEAVASESHEVVVHAGRSEMEFCYRAIGRLPPRVFDVQLAAGLIGIEYPAGYATLLSKLLGKTSKKSETRTDWRNRPLSRRQIEYALDDVRELGALRDRIAARLAELGRLAWLEEETAAWKQEVIAAFGEHRWRRVSGKAGLDARGLAIVRELWHWREAEAQRRNCPARRLLRDDLIVELARRRLADVKHIRSVRGLERGDLQRVLPDIAAAVQQALALPEAACPRPVSREVSPALAVLGQLLFSALGSLCRQMELSPGLVGTPSDVRDLIAYRAGCEGVPAPRLARGWRHEVVGRLFEDLLAGKVAIRITDPLSDQPLAFVPLEEQRPPSLASPGQGAEKGPSE